MLRKTILFLALAPLLLLMDVAPVWAHGTGCAHTHGRYFVRIGGTIWRVPTVTCTAPGAACSTPTVNPGICAQWTAADRFGRRNTNCLCRAVGAQDVDKEQDCGSVQANATSSVNIPGTVTLEIPPAPEDGASVITAMINGEEIGDFTDISGTFVLSFGQNNLDATQIPVIIEELTIDTPSLFVQGAMTGPHHSVLDPDFPAVAEYNSDTGEFNTMGAIRVLQTNDQFPEGNPMEGYGVATATFDTETGGMIFNFCIETPIPKAQPTEVPTTTTASPKNLDK